MGLLVDGEGLWTTKRKMEGGRTGCKLSPRAWSVCVSGGGGGEVVCDGMQSMR